MKRFRYTQSEYDEAKKIVDASKTGGGELYRLRMEGVPEKNLIELVIAQQRFQLWCSKHNATGLYDQVQAIEEKKVPVFIIDTLVRNGWGNEVYWKALKSYYSQLSAESKKILKRH